jgi:hypothetical protein
MSRFAARRFRAASSTRRWKGSRSCHVNVALRGVRGIASGRLGHGRAEDRRKGRSAVDVGSGAAWGHAAYSRRRSGCVRPAARNDGRAYRTSEEQGEAIKGHAERGRDTPRCGLAKINDEAWGHGGAVWSRAGCQGRVDHRPDARTRDFYRPCEAVKKLKITKIRICKSLIYNGRTLRFRLR